MSLTILVTGGAGFLGRRIVGKLRETGDVRIVVLARPRTAERVRAVVGNDNRIEVAEGNLSHPDDCHGLLSGVDVVIHAASAKAAHASLLFAGNVTPTRVLARAAAAAQVKRFVHISSMGVYQPARRGSVLDESCSVDPRPEARDPYTFSKLAQEDALREVSRDTALNIVIVRPGVIYGDGGTFLTPRVGLGVGRFLCVMGGRHPLPYTYVDNCADAIVRAAFTDGIDGQIFNVIDDELPTGRQLVKVAKRRGVALRTIAMPAVVVPFAAAAYERLAGKVPGVLPTAITKYRARAQWTPVKYSNRRARVALSWTPKVPLRSALDMSTCS